MALRIENMEHASIETMHRLGFYWGGCSFDESKPRWMGVTEVGGGDADGYAVFVIVGYSTGESSWFAEAYDLFDIEGTIDGFIDESDPQKALDLLLERLEELAKTWIERDKEARQ